MHGYPHTTAVLPAAKVLFDKLKVSASDIMGDKSPWDSGVIVIVKRFDGKFYFACGCGDSPYFKPGAFFIAHHYQTGRPLFSGTVVNEIIWTRQKSFSEWSYSDPANVLPFDLKAPMGVFK